ncbi:cytochrome c [Alphaproteobacteria bacterium]|jgi:cytochrome c556|nr:cytochrome c [Alphaproteobacteria bacterium]MDB0034578.1 cytochrome c [Alphaproteobacteria bacterium]
MNKYLLIFVLAFSSLFANDVIQQRQESMQDFNKLMRSATQMLKNGEVQRTDEIYRKIESIMLKYPTLFPDDSFNGKTSASVKIIDDRDVFEQLSKEASDLAALAKIAANNDDLELIQQHHQNLFGTCKSCHSRFKN